MNFLLRLVVAASFWSLLVHAALQGQLTIPDAVMKQLASSHATAAAAAVNWTARTRILLKGTSLRHIPVDALGRFSLPSFASSSSSDGQQRRLHLFTMEVQSMDVVFPLVRMEYDEMKQEWRAFSMLPGVEWNAEPNARLSTAPIFLLEATEVKDYFTRRESFSLMSLLANPMFLMMGVSVLMLVAMPKLMENMDPEAVKEAKEAQAALHRGDFKGFLANLSDEPSASGTKSK